ncbi:MAG: ABC-2 transporter permease [Bifidobacteriaceae bacterium]|jgi:hypothetical protein|nr:ABC-2 transporter permease [Bifidobacteriaceae bacterium]
MSSVRRFVRLDLLTVKPHLTARYLVTLLGLAVLFAVIGTFPAGAALAFIVVAIAFAGYPFSADESANLDALYVTLSVSRRTVVLGRFAFLALIDVAAVLAGYALNLPFLLWRHRSLALSGAEVLALLVTALIIGCVQLPVYFKFGYGQAKRIVAVCLVVALFLGIVAANALSPLLAVAPGLRTVADAVSTLPALALVSAGLALLVGCVAASIALSLKFYRAREF